MSTPIPPIIIRGPAIVIRDGLAIYTAGNITDRHTRTGQPTPTDMFGNVGDTLESEQRELSFQPAGELKSLVKLFPYGPSNLATASSVGQSIFGAADVACVIHTLAGQTITYPRSGISKSPILRMGPKVTPLGDMSIVCLGKRDTAPTEAGYWKSIATASFTDVSFTEIIKDIYVASLGERSAPYDAMGARDGFELEFNPELETVPDDNVGIADMLVKSMMAKVRFKPNNLTEAERDALVNFDGADALLPGQYLGRGPSGTPEDLTIDSDVFTAILHAAGVSAAEGGYGMAVDRNGQLEFTYKQTFTSGVPDPLVSLVVN